jgi:hypothetical protein
MSDSSRLDALRKARYGEVLLAHTRAAYEALDTAAQDASPDTRTSVRLSREAYEAVERFLARLAFEPALRAEIELEQQKLRARLAALDSAAR